MHNKPKNNSKFLILPSATLLFCFMLVPLLMLVFFSLVEGNISIKTGISGYTINNYVRIFTENIYPKLIWKSLKIAAVVTAICVLIAYPAAWGLAKIVKEKYRNLLLMIVIIPAITSQLLLIYSIMVLLQADGIVMNALSFLGFIQSGDSILYSTDAVIIVLVYEYLPYMILSLYSVLEKIDNSLIEASHSLGAGRVRTFLNIVLPQSLPGLLVGFLIVFIPAAASFVEPEVAGGPYSTMLGTLIDSQFKTALNTGYGSALSLLFLIIMLFLLVLVNFISSTIEKKIGGEEK